jgi:hypothetical protein
MKPIRACINKPKIYVSDGVLICNGRGAWYMNEWSYHRVPGAKEIQEKSTEEGSCVAFITRNNCYLIRLTRHIEQARNSQVKFTTHPDEIIGAAYLITTPQPKTSERAVEPPVTLLARSANNTTHISWWRQTCLLQSTNRYWTIYRWAIINHGWRGQQTG